MLFEPDSKTRAPAVTLGNVTHERSAVRYSQGFDASNQADDAGMADLRADTGTNDSTGSASSLRCDAPDLFTSVRTTADRHQDYGAHETC
jgi:hypothetical protein